MERPEAGWYPDPEQPGQVRYFDGHRWTTHVADRAPAEPPADGIPAAAPAQASDPEGSDGADGPARGGGDRRGRGMVIAAAITVLVLLFAGTTFLSDLLDGGETTDSLARDSDVGAVSDTGTDSAESPGGEPDGREAGDPDGNASPGTTTDEDRGAQDPAEAADPTVDDEGPEEAAGGPAERDGIYDSPFEITIDPAASYLATIETSEGDIVLELDAAGAPVTTNNLVNLAEDGYYDGIAFHRVIEGFVVQGGDPTGTGAGGPGYRFEDELDVAEGLVAAEGGYPRGTLAMANAGPDTNGSQFFIVHGELVQLAPHYTAFGHVVEGMDVVDAIAATPTDPADRPTSDVTIATIDIGHG